MWVEGGTATNYCDVIAANFGTHLVFSGGGGSLPQNTTAGGGSIISGNMPINAPSNYRR